MKPYFGMLLMCIWKLYDPTNILTYMKPYFVNVFLNMFWCISKLC